METYKEIEAKAFAEAPIRDPVDLEALPVCLWQENPNGLVSWWDLMMFDAGRLAAHMAQLTTVGGMGGPFIVPTPFMELTEDGRKYFESIIVGAHAYCNEVPFPMAAMPLGRIIERFNEPTFTTKDLGQMIGNATERLRDEASTIKLLRIKQERVKYYENTQPFGLEVENSFPSVSYDALEACRCLALNRSTASVSHLMRVLEIGLCVFAKRFSIPSDHTNWQNIIDGIEKAVRGMKDDPARPSDWKDQQEFFSQAASHFMVLKDAWRNYTAHARGKFTEDEAETILINVRAFMQKLATRLCE